MQATAQVIPFQFNKKNVRIINVQGNPWFCLRDVCAVLELSQDRSIKAFRFNDEGVEKFSTPTNGGAQDLYFISEGNVFRLITRSNKPEAIQMERWIFDEVLPAIRKHGRYEDASGRMDTLLGDVIGTTGVNVLNRVIEQKGQPVPHVLQRSFKQTMKSRLRSRFNVQRTELIPASQLADACNFVVAYAIEGEWLGKEPTSNLTLNELDLAMLYVFCIDTLELVHVGEKLKPVFETLRAPLTMNVRKCLGECREAVAHLHERFGPQMEQAARRRKAFDGRLNLAAAGDPSQPIWVSRRTQNIRG